MLLVVDIGNTNTVLGITDGEKLVQRWRLVSERHPSDELRKNESAAFAVLRPGERVKDVAVQHQDRR